MIEVLAALAVASVIIIAVAALIHDVARHFDRGARRVNEAERLLLAVDRLGQDFTSARFVARTTEGGTGVAFAAAPASGDKPAQVAFVASGGNVAGTPGEEVVVLTVEPAGDVTRLVRRRAAWTGSRLRFEDVSPRDAVVLIEARLDIAFAFGRLTSAGRIAWSESWIDEPALPRFVRLILRDRASGIDLLGEADFVVRADAPPACGRPDATSDCLSRAQPAAVRSAETERTPQ